MEITVRMLTKFATRSAAIKALEKRQKNLRDEILDALKDGETIPDESPYTVQLSQQGGKKLDWKGEYEIMLVKALNKKYPFKVALEKAKAKMQKMYDEAEPKDGVTINGITYNGGVRVEPKPNPNYAAAQARKIA